jgi:hypothetical protein
MMSDVSDKIWWPNPEQFIVIANVRTAKFHGAPTKPDTNGYQLHNMVITYKDGTEETILVGSDTLADIGCDWMETSDGT